MAENTGSITDEAIATTSSPTRAPAADTQRLTAARVNDSGDDPATTASIKMDRRLLLFGFLGVVGSGIAMLVGRMVPPPNPAWTAARIARFHADHATALRYAGIALMTGGATIGAWAAVVGKQLRRIDGGRSAMSTVQLILGTCLVLEIIIPEYFIEVAALRAGRGGSEVQVLADVGWTMLLSINYTWVVEMLLIAYALHKARQTQILFPSWLVPLNLIVAIPAFMGCFSVLTKSGPFAYNGLFGFWLNAGSFFVWYFFMTYAIYRAIGTPDRPTSAHHQ